MSISEHAGEPGDLAAQGPVRVSWLSRFGIPSLGRLVYLSELTRELVARDLKLRYKRTILGVAWSLASPLAQLMVLGFVFRFVLNVQIERYLSFLFTGILVWNWLHGSLVASATCVIDNASLLRRPGFPAPILPLVAVTTQFVQFLFSLPFLLIAATIDSDPISISLVSLPLVMALQFLLTLGVGYFLSTLHVEYRDTSHLLDVALMLAFYLSPIFYDGRFVPEPYQGIYRLNPVVHLLEAYRDVIVSGRFPASSTLATLAVAACVAFAVGYWRYRSQRHDFAEGL